MYIVCPVRVLSPFQDHKLAQYDEVEFSIQNVSALLIHGVCVCILLIHGVCVCVQLTVHLYIRGA